MKRLWSSAALVDAARGTVKVHRQFLNAPQGAPSGERGERVIAAEWRRASALNFTRCWRQVDYLLLCLCFLVNRRRANASPREVGGHFGVLGFSLSLNSQGAVLVGLPSTGPHLWFIANSWERCAEFSMVDLTTCHSEEEGIMGKVMISYANGITLTEKPYWRIQAYPDALRYDCQRNALHNKKTRAWQWVEATSRIFRF